MSIHSSPKETQLFWSCLPFGEECRLVNFGPNVISTMLLITICQKTHFKMSSPFPYSHKTSECKSPLKFNKTGNTIHRTSFFYELQWGSRFSIFSMIFNPISDQRKKMFGGLNWKPDASSQFESWLSFLKECMSENLGLYNMSTNPPGNNMQKTPF